MINGEQLETKGKSLHLLHLIDFVLRIALTNRIQLLIFMYGSSNARS